MQKSGTKCLLKSDLTVPGLKCSCRVPLTRFNLHLEEVTRLPRVSDFSSIKHETWVLYNFQSLSCMQQFCVSRNTPELVERGRRGHESDDAHLRLYLKNKNQCAFIVQENVVGIVAIDMHVG